MNHDSAPDLSRSYSHQSVLVKEVLQYLITNKKGFYVDCTLGEGGHSEAILKILDKKEGCLLALDDDVEIQKIASKRLQDYPHKIIKKSNFAHLNSVLDNLKVPQVEGIFADLGLSMYHYKHSTKGFSFSKKDPLDMTLNNYKPNAFDLVNTFSVSEIQDILYKYGEEKHAYRIASFIVYYRENIGSIDNTQLLANIVEKALRSINNHKKQKIHLATKTFQAIRIYVNKEFENLENLLRMSVERLSKNGRLVIITYHSLEDRIVKNFFKNQSKIKIITKKSIIASNEEILKNRASRSAKLRAFEKV